MLVPHDYWVFENAELNSAFKSERYPHLSANLRALGYKLLGLHVFTCSTFNGYKRGHRPDDLLI